MDFIAHGLWGGVAFGRKNKRSWGWAFLWGMAPDLIAFGPAMLIGIFTGDYFGWARYPLDGIPKTAASAWSYHGYHVSHSLTIWACIVLALTLWRKQFPWLYAASALHILCDIPVHALRYFPTPYLWPLHTPMHDGTPWANPLFMLVNYVLIVSTYVALYTYKRRVAR